MLENNNKIEVEVTATANSEPFSPITTSEKELKAIGERERAA
jgi:hypothetical protein